MKGKNRPKRNTKRPKQKPGPAAAQLDRTRFYPHRQFGNIPLVPRTYTDGKGVEHVIHDYDPSYQPPMPEGAVRGDVRKQSLCPICDVPKYFYVDQGKRCVQCGEDFIFSAKEQKHWFETLQFYIYSQAIRCVKCRKLARSEKALQQQLMKAKRLLKGDANNVSALLELSECIAEYRDKFEKGDIEEGIRAARKARKAWPEAFEALYWEGRCQLAASRGKKAVELFRQFLNEAPNSKRYSKLRADAERRVTLLVRT